MDDYRSANRRVWNQYTAVNARSDLYRLESFKAGENKLNPLEMGEVGDVRAKSLLHLQCHFGMDTLSWARLGAQVTGMDLSDEAIALARSLSAELNLPARFICCDLYDLPDHLDETFDVVFTSYGVLNWLPDIRRWARTAARFVRPGGVFYIAEFHPFAWAFDSFAADWRVAYDYFDPNALIEPSQGCYSDRSAVIEGQTYEWAHPLGEVVSALIEAGLRIEFLHEFPYSVYEQFPFLRRGEDGYWRAPETMKNLPLMFSIRAIRG